jgi:hypothetical protein
MSEEKDELESLLSRLARQTEGVGARPGFERRVMAAIAREPAPGWYLGLVRTGRVALVAAGLAAAASFALAVQSDARYSSAVAVGDEIMELDW